MTKHHRWCNYFQRPREGCKMCARLEKEYPVEPGEDAMQKYFAKEIEEGTIIIRTINQSMD